LITGGATGIGKEMLKYLVLDFGCNIVIAGRRSKSLEDTTKEVNTLGISLAIIIVHHYFKFIILILFLSLFSVFLRSTKKCSTFRKC
jgi:hypothetical protein